ncbi:ADP-forming succinate--CoA ligase subunit beta [Dehalococcoidia bacterium]|nr:ADP-forming succinate--CoA ligase subunit beta [Dehalococcoidia bacterium]
MKIHEYQAKELLGSFGVAVPKGGVAYTSAEARTAAEDLGGSAVVKVQVHAGGRGKAGGVRLVDSPEDAETAAKELIGNNIVTIQTGPAGAPVTSVLVEEILELERELYLSVIIDGSIGRTIIIASEAGGMEIEEVAAETPEKIHQAVVDPIIGYQPFQGRALATDMELNTAESRAFSALLANLLSAFSSRDCSMIEINPLVITKDGRLLAADAKVNFDDNGTFRQSANSEMRDGDQEDPLERQANDQGIQYIKLDGDVGCMVNGAGLAMATMDLTQAAGLSPANFLDVGGGASEEQITAAYQLIVSDPSVKKVLVNIFGGILRCDVLANGIVAAYKDDSIDIPLVIRMTGTNWEDGQQILRDSGIKCTIVNDLEEVPDAVRNA